MRRVFIAMPFSDAFWNVWKVIKAAVEACGAEPRRVDLLAHVPNIHAAIRAEIAACDAVVADFSSDVTSGHANSNVVWEASQADALSKPLVLMSQSADTLAFDTRVKQAILYTNSESGRQILGERLRDAVRAALGDGAGPTPSPRTPPAIPDFTFVREESFACGGQSHTVGVYRFERFARALPADASSITAEFVLIPSGTFQMGTTAWKTTQPVHTVTIQKPFLLARTPVTQAIW